MNLPMTLITTGAGAAIGYLAGGGKGGAVAIGAALGTVVGLVAPRMLAASGGDADGDGWPDAIDADVGLVTMGSGTGAATMDASGSGMSTTTRTIAPTSYVGAKAPAAVSVAAPTAGAGLTAARTGGAVGKAKVSQGLTVAKDIQSIVLP